MNPAPAQIRALRWWAAAPIAALGGLSLDAATPWLEWWPAGLVGAFLVIGATWQQRSSAGLLYGLIAGGTFWLPHIAWLTLYLGPIPWLALASVMIAWFGAFGLLSATATRGLTKWMASRPPAKRSVPLLIAAQSLTVAGLWVAREQAQSTWPYGGFAWGRLAHTQADSPLASAASWLGFAGFSGVLAFACALTIAILAVRTRDEAGFSGGKKLVGTLAVAAILATMWIVPTATLDQVGEFRVAAVQGNSKSGIFDDRENGDVFRDHADATSAALEQLESAGETVDLIVWPENSGEFQLPEQTFRLLEMQRLSARAHAPIVVGTVLHNPDDTFTNSSIVVDEAGDTGLRYDKRRPVPFAEYMPNRAFFRSLVPDLVDLVQLDYSFGALPSALAIDTAAGIVQAGIAICFDIIFDDHAVAMIESGAEVILAQTNNADFGRTDESAQQLQIARLRAIESGRALINISTVGTSAVILPDGSEIAGLEPFTQNTMIVEVPLYDGVTPALRYGAVLAGIWIFFGIAGTLFAVVAARRSFGGTASTLSQ